MLLDTARTHLVLIDFQERLMPAIYEADKALKNAAILLEAALSLEIPVSVSEQYPRGLGPTVTVLKEKITENRIFEESTFSAFQEKTFRDTISQGSKNGRRQIVIAGVEAHVCVLQTAIDLLDADYDVFMVSDAVSSRSPTSVSAAHSRFVAAGGHWITTEMAVFEWLEKAKTPEFKALSALIK